MPAIVKALDVSPFACHCILCQTEGRLCRCSGSSCLNQKCISGPIPPVALRTCFLLQNVSADTYPKCWPKHRVQWSLPPGELGQHEISEADSMPLHRSCLVVPYRMDTSTSLERPKASVTNTWHLPTLRPRSSGSTRALFGVHAVNPQGCKKRLPCLRNPLTDLPSISI